MKIKLLNLLNKILKKFAFLGIFSFTTSASAQTIYQCLPCPDGKTSNPGAVGAGSCFSVTNKKGTVVLDQTTTNKTITLQPGWYRVTLRTTDGAKGLNRTEASKSGTCCEDTYGNCTSYIGKVVGDSATGGAGGKGKDLSYVIYVANSSSASYTYNSGAPKLIVKDNTTNGQKVFSITKAGNGKDATCSSSTSGGSSSTYGSSSCGAVTTWNCTNGAAGTASSIVTPSGLSSKDQKSSAIDGLTSATGCRITKL